MHSTQFNITNNFSSSLDNKVINKYERYPDNTENRIAEGGLRLQNKYKQSIENKPLVSIITVCFNSEKTLERTILSILAQSYDNIEYIIIDGASTDATLSIIKKYEDYIDYYVSEPDDGIYFAMNKGLELASGDYIAILNSDDYYYHYAVELSIKQIIKDNTYVSTAGFYYSENDVLTLKFCPYSISVLHIFHYAAARHETFFVSKYAYNKIGYYDTKYKIASDFKFKCFIFSIYKVSIIKEPIAIIELDGTSANIDNREFIYNEFYKILLEITDIELEDIKKLLLFVSDKIVFDNFIENIERMKRQYNFSDELINSLINLHTPNTLHKKNDRKLTFLEHIFSVYTREKFVEIRILGIKISVKRKNAK